MELRKPKLSEVEQLFQIELENYGADESTEMETFQALVEFPEDYPGYQLITLVDEDVLGFYCTIEEDDYVELVDIAVKKDYQGRGLGLKLLEHCVSAQGMMTIGLTVREDNRSAIALYKKLGFHQVEVVEDYYDDCNGLRFERSIL
ncbi:FR47-like protein [Bacteriovorax sp. BAL6_X]|uniref:GNAT family N-acetyltransferase n=1 Tax=Bacteriovorax sp. BAL6_X TaxID=1201290 RepID=UPI000385CAD4|nr:GNAT family N-acetyltransferase [Bacteriovorax sp. BAL6_X]EPZ49653.1 FR47-like protein [Bacteriovorax sp. BAL6_X]